MRRSAEQYDSGPSLDTRALGLCPFYVISMAYTEEPYPQSEHEDDPVTWSGYEFPLLGSICSCWHHSGFCQPRLVGIELSPQTYQTQNATRAVHQHLLNTY